MFVALWLCVFVCARLLTPQKNVAYLYARTVRCIYRTENLEILERREADPIKAMGYAVERRKILERRGAALMGQGCWSVGFRSVLLPVKPSNAQ